MCSHAQSSFGVSMYMCKFTLAVAYMSQSIIIYFCIYSYYHILKALSFGPNAWWVIFLIGMKEQELCVLSLHLDSLISGSVKPFFFWSNRII